MEPRHNGCANCQSREEALLKSGLIGEELSIKLGYVNVSVAVCSKCIHLVELTKGETHG